ADLGSFVIQSVNCALRRHCQIRWFYIAMNDRRISRMQFFQSIEQLVGPIEHLGHGKGLLSQFEQLSQVMTWNKLHDQELSVAVREVIHHPRQGRMAEICQQLSFASESASLFVSCRESFLDRNHATEILVHRLIDGAHSAMAELMDYAI